MIKYIFKKLLANSGKEYSLDDNIPSDLLLKVLIKRVVMMIRGLIILRSKVFLGSGVKISNKKNIQFGNSCTIEKHVDFDTYSSSKIILGNSVKIGAYSTISITSHMSKYGKGLVLGNNSSIGEYSYLGSSGGIEIGDDVIMGQYISFHSENHNFSDKNKLIREQGVSSNGIIIGNDVWVGAKVTFLDGAEINNHSVVASGSVVKGSFPPNVVIGGIPAKIIKEI